MVRKISLCNSTSIFSANCAERKCELEFTRENWLEFLRKVFFSGFDKDFGGKFVFSGKVSSGLFVYWCVYLCFWVEMGFKCFWWKWFKSQKCSKPLDIQFGDKKAGRNNHHDHLIFHFLFFVILLANIFKTYVICHTAQKNQLELSDFPVVKVQCSQSFLVRLRASLNNILQSTELCSDGCYFRTRDIFRHWKAAYLSL